MILCLSSSDAGMGANRVRLQTPGMEEDMFSNTRLDCSVAAFQAFFKKHWPNL